MFQTLFLYGKVSWSYSWVEKGFGLENIHEMPHVWKLFLQSSKYCAFQMSISHQWWLVVYVVTVLISKMMMMGSYNAQHIYPIGYSRCCCGATPALIRQPQTHPHNEEPEIRNRILWEGVRFLGEGGNRSARRKPTKGGMELANQIHIQPLASCIGERKVYEH